MAKQEMKILSEDDKKVIELKNQLRAIRQKGKFMLSYVKIRTATNDIRKSEVSETEKKKALMKVCFETAKEIEVSLAKK